MTEQTIFAWLNQKYVQHSDARQKSMGLQYMEAETHDLARELSAFLKTQGTEKNSGAVHELKIDPAPFEAVLSGAKKHEIRQDDRGFQVGDTLVLKETRYTREDMAEHSKPLEYTGRTLSCTVTHIQQGYGLPDGMVVMSIEI